MQFCGNGARKSDRVRATPQKGRAHHIAPKVQYQVVQETSIIRVAEEEGVKAQLL
jgi:hypothetical protein